MYSPLNAYNVEITFRKIAWQDDDKVDEFKA